MNLSEGRSARVIDALVAAGGRAVLDSHVDPHHHRCVLWLVGEDAPRAVAVEAVARIDLRRHAGVHPRMGAVDVAPFVPLDGGDQGAGAAVGAIAARDRFGAWMASELRVPAFSYGPERSLPEVRRGAFGSLRPEAGALLPHPTAGAVAVGARPPLVAYNVWLASGSVDQAQAIARGLRGPSVRALGLRVGAAVQVSTNLLDPTRVGPAEVYDAVAARASISRAELVGLVPSVVLDGVAGERWEQLDLAVEKTVEWRLARALPGIRPDQAGETGQAD